jgi:hypothetical protein
MIHVFAAHEVGDGGLDVFDALGGVLEAAGLALGFALVGSIVAQADETCSGKDAGVVSCRSRGQYVLDRREGGTGGKGFQE